MSIEIIPFPEELTEIDTQLGVIKRDLTSWQNSEFLKNGKYTNLSNLADKFNFPNSKAKAVSYSKGSFSFGYGIRIETTTALPTLVVDTYYPKKNSEPIIQKYNSSWFWKIVDFINLKENADWHPVL